MFNLSVAEISFLSSMPKSIYCTVFHIHMFFLSVLRLALERRESMMFFFTLAPISPMYILLRLWSLAPTALGTTTQQFNINTNWATSV
jgi:hypothetical protein